MGSSEGEPIAVGGVAGLGEPVEIRTCSVAAKSGVGIGGLVNIRKKPGPKIPINSKKPQAKIMPAGAKYKRLGCCLYPVEGSVTH